MMKGEIKTFSDEVKLFYYLQTNHERMANGSYYLNKKEVIKQGNLGHQENRKNIVSKIILNTVKFLSPLGFLKYI